MDVFAALWVSIGLPALVVAPLAVERGRTPAWGLLALLSYPGMIAGLITLVALPRRPGESPDTGSGWWPGSRGSMGRR